MNTSPTGKGGSSHPELRQHGMLNSHIDHRMTNTINGHSNSNVGNVSNSYNNTINVGIEEESLRIQEWLSPLEPGKRHHDVQSSSLDGVGEWVLRRSEFESWCKSRDGAANRALLCYGDQGVGKTHISSLVIEALRERTRGQNMAVMYLYCDYRTQKDQSAVNMIGGLVRQAALRAPRIPSEIKSAFDESKKEGGDGLQLPNMMKLFVQVTGYIEIVYLCVDAVDEMLPQQRLEFLRAIRQILQDAPNIRLFLTGRPYIRAELDKHLAEKAYAIHIVADQGDIIRYLKKRMDDDDYLDPGLMTEDLRNNIMKTMLEGASETFLPVALNIEAILGETSLASRKQMLQKVATTDVGLGSVYHQTLERIQKQKGDRSRLGLEVLMWVSHAKRPLRIDELCHALAVDTRLTDLDPENIRPQDTVIGSCLGLVVVDAETSTVRLIHYTLQEYLSRRSVFPDAHEKLGQACLAYLNYKQVERLPADDVSNLGKMPFLTYSSLHWGSHAKVELSDRARSLALELLNRAGNHISATLLLGQIGSFHACLPNHTWPSLHCASYFGIAEIVAALIEEEGCDINQSDCMNYTALMWAARQGNEGVVRMLLAQNDVEPNEPRAGGLTPLWWASYNGDVGVAKLLLARNDVDPGKPVNDGRTPLWNAASQGHEGVARLLLARNDIDPNDPNKDGETPLWRASSHGHEGVVKLLLARNDIDPNKPSNDDRTPLRSASSNGHEGVVKLLLARNDVDPDKPSHDGLTPLWWASYDGHDGVVKLLLARDDVNPGKPSNNVTPLWNAASQGHEGVARLLLARNDIDPNDTDEDGRTPLWRASFYGHEGVVKLLLARNDIDPNKPSNDGRTPLWGASSNGHEGVVKLLLAWNDIDPNKPSNDGRTPLQGASSNGHEGVVKLLLARDDVDPAVGTIMNEEIIGDVPHYALNVEMIRGVPHYEETEIIGGVPHFVRSWHD